MSSGATEGHSAPLGVVKIYDFPQEAYNIWAKESHEREIASASIASAYNAALSSRVVDEQPKASEFDTLFNIAPEGIIKHEVLPRSAVNYMTGGPKLHQQRLFGSQAQLDSQMETINKFALEGKSPEQQREAEVIIDALKNLQTQRRDTELTYGKIGSLVGG
jgi:hypothetical protein